MKIEVWHATSSRQDPGRVEQVCEGYLDSGERRKADQFRQPTSRNQHVIGRGMARRLIGEQTGVDPSQIEFGLEQYGKPFVIAPGDAARPFNVAHTSGLVLCGLAEKSPAMTQAASVSSVQLGVDVEAIDRRTDPAIAERFFSKPEVDHLRACVGEADRRLNFLRIWTLKESFIKAIGTGMSTPLADFAFEQIDSERPVIRMLSDELDVGNDWQFSVFEPRPGFIAATAICTGKQTPVPELSLSRFDDMV
jgi:4'-phosphopantetheinyl transferase